MKSFIPRPFGFKKKDSILPLFYLLYCLYRMWRKTKRGLVLDPPEFKNFKLTIILKTMSFMLYICEQRAL